MIFDIVFDNVDFDDVFPEVIVLDIGNLSVLVFFLHQIAEVVSFHIFYYFYQAVVKG